VVSAWTKGGNVPDAIVRLQATPASVTPQFSFGCGSSNGTASCDLGAVDAKSAERQLQAESMVPATASAVKSVRLTVIGSAASLPKDPKAYATVAVNGSVAVTQPTPATSPLPVGSLPGVSTINPSTGATLSPGGNASGLFPTLKPSPGASSTSSSGTKAALNAKARQAADTSALPEGASVVGAQLAGLAALLVAFVLAVTRFSIRRRPAPAAAAPATAAPTAEPTATPAAEPAAAAKAADSEPSDAASQPGESADPAQGPADTSDHDSADPSDEDEDEDEDEKSGPEA
jgi:hypothetical protein